MNRYLCVYLDEYINTHVNLIEADTEEEGLNKYVDFLNNLGVQCFKNEIYITEQVNNILFCNFLFVNLLQSGQPALTSWFSTSFYLVFVSGSCARTSRA